MLWIALGLVLLVASFVAGRFSRRNTDAILPPPVVTAVEHEKADRARVDSTIIADTLKAVAAQQRQTIAEERAELARSASAKIGLFADSLARRAAMAHNAADSAALYRQALIVRTDERDSLLFVIVGKDAAIKAANDRAADFRAGLLVSDPARQRADSVLDSVVGAVNKAECRVPLTFGLLKCMSRTKAAVVGVAIGVGGTLAVQAIRDGRLKIPLRLP
jgi:hypothetical protein